MGLNVNSLGSVGSRLDMAQLVYSIRFRELAVVVVVVIKFAFAALD